MRLKTHRSPEPIVPLETRKYNGPMKPGDFVTHFDYGGTGMIVAIKGDQMSVLWSEEPKNPFETMTSSRRGIYFKVPYVPLQVTPSLLYEHKK